MILVLNAGSSSLKYKLFKPDGSTGKLLKSGSVNDIGRSKCANFVEASKKIHSEIKTEISEIEAVGHRIVFGGPCAADGDKLNNSTLKNLIKVSHLAPLHNPAAIATIKYFSRALTSPQYLYYDNSFYSTLLETESTIPINQAICKKLGIKRYGFHGISHQYAYTNSESQNYSKVISIHIGAGSSVTAIKDGKAIATSMGLTPLGGICMLTRSGDIDPGIITYLVRSIGISKTENILNKSSGLTGIIGKESSFFDILFFAGEKIEDDSYKPGCCEVSNDIKANAKLAIDIFVSKTKQFIGAYSAIMGGVDGLVFTGRAGAGSSVLRDKICRGLDYLNLKQVMIVEPDEELAIANKIIEKYILPLN